MSLLYPERTTLQPQPAALVAQPPQQLLSASLRAGRPSTGAGGAFSAAGACVDFRLGTGNRRPHPEHDRASAAGDLLYPDRPQTQSHNNSHFTKELQRERTPLPQKPSQPPSMVAKPREVTSSVLDNATGRVSHSIFVGQHAGTPTTRREQQYRQKQLQRQQRQQLSSQEQSRPSHPPPSGAEGGGVGTPSYVAPNALAGVRPGLAIKTAGPHATPIRERAPLGPQATQPPKRPQEAEEEVAALRTQVAALTNMLQQGVRIDMDEILVASSDAEEGSSLQVRCDGGGWHWRFVRE